MKKQMLLALVFLTAAAVPALAADGAQPASTNVRGAEYPKVHSDLRITFRLVAPSAQKVQFVPPEAGNTPSGLGKAPIDLVKDKEGVWTVTVPPVVPGFHYYWLLVNGVAVNNPGSGTFFGFNKPTSGIEVPEPGADFYGIKEVPHGEVRARWYFSKIAGQWRKANIYAPPGYETDHGKCYPVLYLQQGGGEDENGWTRQGRANFILDNLLAAGKAQPMIIVMNCGYATVPGEAPVVTRPDRPAAPPRHFTEVMVREIIPMIDAAYRTLPDRAHRAMAGLSMGGGRPCRSP